MDLTQYLTTLRDQLVAVAATGGDETRHAASLLTTGLEPSARLALMHALSDLAAEVTAALDDRVVEVTLDGLDLRISVSSTADLLEPLGDEGSDEREGGEVSRISLRLPSALKRRAERRAAESGVSLNTWLVEAVREAVRTSGGSRGHRVRGWVQA